MFHMVPARFRARSACRCGVTDEKPRPAGQQQGGANQESARSHRALSGAYHRARGRQFTDLRPISAWNMQDCLWAGYCHPGCVLCARTSCVSMPVREEFLHEKACGSLRRPLRQLFNHRRVCPWRRTWRIASIVIDRRRRRHERRFSSHQFGWHGAFIGRPRQWPSEWTGCWCQSRHRP